MKEQTLEQWVAKAQRGERNALDVVLRAVKKDIYNLALRMLWCPHDVADACQEILLKVVTHLSTYEGRSAFRTWVYRVALNHLLNQTASRMEARKLTFDQFAEDLAVGNSAAPENSDSPEYQVLVREVRVGCTHAMLICLDREHRAAFVLGDILDVSSQEASDILGIGDAAFRKRLSRARQRILEFMSAHCGLVGDNAPCRCEQRVEHACASGLVNPGKLLFVQAARDAIAVSAQVDQLTNLQRLLATFRGNPQPEGPDESLQFLRQLFDQNVLHCLH